MYLRFSVEGEVQISRALLKISSAVQDLTPAFEKSGEDLTEILSYDVFETEGAAIDEHWQPLSIAYSKTKARKFPGQPILVASGLMRDSFVPTANANSLVIRNMVEYFKYHQSRAERKSNLPRRVMMKLTENMREMVVKNVQRQLQEAAA